jgi:hypothetical protein
VLAASLNLKQVSLSILSCNQNGDHPENNLAKSGYMLDMKVGKKKEWFLGCLVATYYKLL